MKLFHIPDYPSEAQATAVRHQGNTVIFYVDHNGELKIILPTNVRIAWASRGLEISIPDNTMPDTRETR